MRYFAASDRKNLPFEYTKEEKTIPLITNKYLWIYQSIFKPELALICELSTRYELYATFRENIWNHKAIHNLKL